MSSFIYVSSQEELFYKLESIVLWQREHALECHHLGNRLAEEGWRRFQHLPTHTEYRLCVKIMVRVSLTASLTRHIYLCLSMIFGFGLICTAAVSSMLFTTTSSQPCYCRKYKHKTIASPPPTHFAEEFQTSVTVFCSLAAKPRGQGPIMLYNQGYGMDTLSANPVAFC